MYEVLLEIKSVKKRDRFKQKLMKDGGKRGQCKKWWRQVCNEKEDKMD
ncbi:hypothetical protein SLEP1_g42898 [Rubroshorea leprosula]|uniref:Uncharacterized protein n=1 Tax=Rubroshorea leprosula TaxID=152421 RepID=A0AAV5LBQ2_9ROSI|nr:hypothetical protein SLEP1_g42898 [Rubroshorea leprosula]